MTPEGQDGIVKAVNVRIFSYGILPCYRKLQQKMGENLSGITGSSMLAGQAATSGSKVCGVLRTNQIEFIKRQQWVFVPSGEVCQIISSRYKRTRYHWLSFWTQNASVWAIVLNSNSSPHARQSSVVSCAQLENL